MYSMRITFVPANKHVGSSGAEERECMDTELFEDHRQEKGRENI